MYKIYIFHFTFFVFYSNFHVLLTLKHKEDSKAYLGKFRFYITEVASKIILI